MEYKYNVGDKVRILDGSKILDYTAGWTKGMNSLVGEVRKITGRTAYDERPHYFLDGPDALGYKWDERGLKLVETKKSKPRIVVYIDKNDSSVVVAKDTETGKTGKAKCSQEDTFDFYTGAQLAMMRLFDTKPFPEEPKKWIPKDGDYVIGNEKNGYAFTSGGTIWKIAAVCGRSITVSSPNSNVKYPVDCDFFDHYTGPLFTGDMVCVKDDGTAFPKYVKGRIYHVKEGGIEGEVSHNGYITSVEALNAEYKDRYKFLEIVK